MTVNDIPDKNVKIQQADFMADFITQVGAASCNKLSNPDPDQQSRSGRAGGVRPAGSDRPLTLGQTTAGEDYPGRPPASGMADLNLLPGTHGPLA